MQNISGIYSPQIAEGGKNMKILKIIGIILLVLIAAVLIMGIIAPKKYEVVRSEMINAPISLVSSHVLYWKSWEAWLPWAEMDSTIEITVEGVDGTKGSVFKWTGRRVVWER